MSTILEVDCGPKIQRLSIFQSCLSSSQIQDSLCLSKTLESEGRRECRLHREFQGSTLKEIVENEVEGP